MKLRRLRRLGAGLLLAGATTVALAPLAAGAADTPTVLAIRAIDATKQDATKVTFLYSGDPTKLSGLTLREDGLVRKIDDLTTIDKTDTRVGTVFVVDLSGSMDDEGTLTAVKRQLRDYASSLPEGDQMAIVSFSDEPVVESTFSDDQNQLEDAIKGLVAPSDGHTATYDALREAASLLDRKDKLQTNVVLVTDGGDDVSTANLASARAAILSSGSGFFAIQLDHAGQVDTGAINSIIARVGGAAFDAKTAADVPAAFESLTKTLRSQYVATYRSNASQGQVAVSIALDGQTSNASFVAGAQQSGGATIRSIAEPAPFGPAFLHTKVGGLVGLGLIGLAAGLGAFALANLAGRTDESLQAVLRPYSEGPTTEDEHDGALAQTALLQRAVELTEDFAERQGFLVKVERALERADLPLRAAEGLFFWGAAVVLFTLGSLALGGITLGMFMLLIAILVPPAVVNFLASRRSKAFQSALPDTLSLLSGSLRAGYSLLQGVEAVSKEVEDPMGKELRRVMTEARLGREVEDALEAVAERMNSADFSWAVMAIRIQREVGGNLSELLLTVADTMVHRERLRRDVAALTAEGKISAIILGLLPIGLGAFMWLGNPEYMHPLGTTTMGHVLLLMAVVSGLIGFAWMKKIIAIEI